jgi:hypothetical protein
MERIPFVLLTSHAFSGSTLTGFLLSTHPKIATVGELTGPESHLDLDTYTCSCGRPFQEDPFWQEVTAVVNDMGAPYSLDQYMGTRFELGRNRYLQRLRTYSLRSNALERIRDAIMFNLWPGHRRNMEALAARNAAFARAILHVTGKSIFLDTSKNPMRIRYLQLSSAIDLYVIHLVRDVRGVVTSIMSRNPQKTVEAAAKSWLMREHNIARHLQAIPADRQIKIHYEDVAREPLPTVNRIFHFLQAPEMGSLPDFREVDNHILGNRMRMRNSSEIRLDERWRTTLTDTQLQLINRLVGATA